MTRMEKPPARLVKGQRVRLKDGVSPEFYGGMSCTGNEGWVRATQLESRYGYPKIFVEWDKDHWAYNQAPDTWTWEGHFEMVGDDMTESNDKELFEQFLAWKKGQSPEAEEGSARYARILAEAAEALEQAEAFIILTTERVTVPGFDEKLLNVQIFRDALTPEGELACNVRVTDLVGLLYAELALSQKRRGDDHADA